MPQARTSRVRFPMVLLECFFLLTYSFRTYHKNEPSLFWGVVQRRLGSWLPVYRHHLQTVQEANTSLSHTHTHTHTRRVLPQTLSRRHHPYTRWLAAGFDPAILLYLPSGKCFSQRNRFVRSQRSTILALVQALTANEENCLG